MSTKACELRSAAPWLSEVCQRTAERWRDTPGPKREMAEAMRSLTWSWCAYNDVLSSGGGFLAGRPPNGADACLRRSYVTLASLHELA